MHGSTSVGPEYYENNFKNNFKKIIQILVDCFIMFILFYLQYPANKNL